jgi:FAD/FMN-containing dehydrogenase
MGYDVKQLFVGGEGTLGIVTAAVLRLAPAWVHSETAFVALDSPAAALALLARLRRDAGDVVVAFELLQHFGVDLAIRAVPGVSMPLADEAGWYVLVEVASSGTYAPVRDALERSLATALELGEIGDAVIAETIAQRQAFWSLREALVEGKRSVGLGISIDVAVPPGLVPDFITRGSALAAAILPGARALAFGHVGDGNIHFSVHSDVADFPGAAMARGLHDLVIELGGSICAEHGVGRKMHGAIVDAVGAVEMGVFASLKNALDPEHRMNPGVILLQSSRSASCETSDIP